MNVALQAVPGSVVAIEHDFWDVPEWNVHILPTGAYGPVEVKIHEGSVIGTEPSDDDDFVNPQGVSFSIEAAIKAAMDLTKGQFDSAELKLFNGAPMWVVDMDASSASGDVKVVVNPATGEAMVYSD
ncbi:MAG: hypothetical protein Q3999_05625 [Buchananella hordeovulneris]|nr:hypothetical protein [Buchananella hordeovulneris]